MGSTIPVGKNPEFFMEQNDGTKASTTLIDSLAPSETDKPAYYRSYNVVATGNGDDSAFETN